MQKHFRKDGSSVHEPEWEDVTPAGYGPGGMPKLKLTDLVRSVDYEGDEWGGDFEKVVGDQIGTVVEIDEDPDGTQYTVLFPDGTTIMDSLGPPDEPRFELVNESKMKISKRQLKNIITELGIDRMTSGDRDPRLEDQDDLTLGEETLEKMITHLQALNDLMTSESGQRTLPSNSPFADQIQVMLPWAQNYLKYWRE